MILRHVLRRLTATNRQTRRSPVILVRVGDGYKGNIPKVGCKTKTALV